LRLTADYVHPFESVSGIRSRCRIRVYLPEQEHDAPVVVCSELPGNPGIPVTGAVENIAAEVIRTSWLVDPVWIEYHPEKTTAAGVESIELVVFYDHKIREAVYHAGSRIEIGEPSWKAIDRRSVEIFLGRPLD
jgi:hypothetical protein